MDVEPVSGGAARTRCTGCRARFVDAGAPLWEFVDVVAVEQENEVAVMLELSVPVPESAAPRPPAAVQVVLDRSQDGRST